MKWTPQGLNGLIFYQLTCEPIKLNNLRTRLDDGQPILYKSMTGAWHNLRTCGKGIKKIVGTGCFKNTDAQFLGSTCCGGS